MITASSPVTATVTGPGSSLRTISPSSFGHDRDAGLLDLGRDLHTVRDLEVGADELEAVGGRGDPQILENGQRAAPARDRPLRGRDRVGEGVALAAELHLSSSMPSKSEFLVVVVVGPVDCGRPGVRAAHGACRVLTALSTDIHRASCADRAR